MEKLQLTVSAYSIVALKQQNSVIKGRQQTRISHENLTRIVGVIRQKEVKISGNFPVLMVFTRATLC